MRLPSFSWHEGSLVPVTSLLCIWRAYFLVDVKVSLSLPCINAPATFLLKQLQHQRPRSGAVLLHDSTTAARKSALRHKCGRAAWRTQEQSGETTAGCSPLRCRRCYHWCHCCR